MFVPLVSHRLNHSLVDFMGFTSMNLTMIVFTENNTIYGTVLVELCLVSVSAMRTCGTSCAHTQDIGAQNTRIIWDFDASIEEDVLYL
jgi:hypothetical protein